ncbi:MAG: type II secretion system protein [Gammaproteobacteria bacterium]
MHFKPFRLGTGQSASTPQAGFSLVELVTVLLIITVLSTIAIRSTVDLGFSVRYEQTRERLDSIRQAIIGNPKRSINGQPDISGFVADMGRLPDNVRELIQRYDCASPAGASPNDCTTPAVPEWVDSANISVDLATLLRYGWNGPYLNVSDDPSVSDAYTDGWGRQTEDFCTTSPTTDPNTCPDASQADWLTSTPGFNNYGWYFNQLAANTLTVQSYGRNHTFDSGVTCSGDSYNGDCAIIIGAADHLVGFNTLTVSFRKPLNDNAVVLPPTSFCDDASANPPSNSKATCATTWYGGCDQLGFLNKSSCTGAGHNWYQCNLNTLHDGEPGYASCAQPSCYKSKVECEKAGGIWFDGNHEIITNRATVFYVQKNICLKVFYRNGSAITVVASDNTDTVNDSSPVQINEDGGMELVRFRFDSDPATAGFQDVMVPLGINAVAVYEYDGISCATSTALYPSDRSPVQIQFVPHANVPLIYW